MVLDLRWTVFSIRLHSIDARVLVGGSIFYCPPLKLRRVAAQESSIRSTMDLGEAHKPARITFRRQCLFHPRFLDNFRLSQQPEAGSLARGSRFAADKPGDGRKENAHGYSAHQHADDALERTKHPPVRRKYYITVPDRCITACRKIEGRFPRRETEPAIAAGPQ